VSISDQLGELREVELPQGTIRYRERGAGQPIVFVHGVLVTGDLWRNVVPALASDFRCVTPDLPLGAHELPMNREADLSPPGIAALLAGFLDALDLKSVTLVGNDTGGAVCQMLVTSRPERVGRLVLTDCDAYDNFPPFMFRYLKWSAFLPGSTFLLAQSMRFRPLRRLPFAFGWLTKRPIDRDVEDSYVRNIAASAGVRRDGARLLRSISPAQTRAVAEKLPGFDQPVLIAWAPEDRFFPFQHAERLARDFPNARLERIEDSRTFVPEDQPERLAALISEFVRATSSAAAA
jgi:pimeloyl-ACP methyl ester carboxylesterase